MQKADILLKSFFHANGWNVLYLANGGIQAEKIISFPHLEATILNGCRLVIFRVDSVYRYLEAIDGWEHVIADIDLREFEDASNAVETLLQKAY